MSVINQGSIIQIETEIGSLFVREETLLGAMREAKLLEELQGVTDLPLPVAPLGLRLALRTREMREDFPAMTDVSRAISEDLYRLAAVLPSHGSDALERSALSAHLSKTYGLLDCQFRHQALVSMIPSFSPELEMYSASLFELLQRSQRRFESRWMGHVGLKDGIEMLQGSLKILEKDLCSGKEMCVLHRIHDEDLTAGEIANAVQFGSYLHSRTDWANTITEMSNNPEDGIMTSEERMNAILGSRSNGEWPKSQRLEPLTKLSEGTKEALAKFSQALVSISAKFDDMMDSHSEVDTVPKVKDN